MALACVLAATAAYLLMADTLRAARYASPTPAVITEPNTGSPIVSGPIDPTHLHLPDAGVNTIVEPAPATDELNPFTGAVDWTYPVPGGPFTTVWWQEGPRPGGDGLAVILGHARSAGPAVFNDLPKLAPGAELGLSGRGEAAEPVVARYLVTEVVTEIPKADPSALRAVLDAAPAGATLALITCSGELDQDVSARSDNTVVFATLEATYRG